MKTIENESPVTSNVVPLALTSIVLAFIGYVARSKGIVNFPCPKHTWKWESLLIATLNHYSPKVPQELWTLNSFEGARYYAMPNVVQALESYGSFRRDRWHLTDLRHVDVWSKELSNGVLETMLKIAQKKPDFFVRESHP